MRNLQQWTEPLQPETAQAITLDLLGMHASYAGKIGADLYNLAFKGDISAIVRYKGLDVNCLSHTPESLYHARQMLAFYSKNKDVDIGCDKEATAWNTFLEGEKACWQTNTRFLTMWCDDWYKDAESGELHRASGGFTSSEIVFLTQVRQWVSTILGPCPSFGELKSYFGPGANVGVPKKEACPLNKMRGSLTCSEALYRSGLLEALISTAPAWFSQREEGYAINDQGWLYSTIPFELEIGRLRFAPKNAETSRAMNIEPVANGYFQGGVGEFLARRLKKCGVDIGDQTRNQRLALDGSRNWENAERQISTLDLKNASGTQSSGLIDFVVDDPKWRYLLNGLRTPAVRYKDHVVTLEQFSTMGNGFTFPLETTIFTAIVLAAMKIKPFKNSHINSRGAVNFDHIYALKDVGIYGDDIIVPTQFVGDVIRGLEICGYSVNPSKSFVSGPFRESCGCDYYKGIPVRPFYQRAHMTLESLFSLHNFYVDRGLTQFAERVKRAIPEEWRLYGPPGYGDGHLVSTRWKEYPVGNTIEKVWTWESSGDTMDETLENLVKAKTVVSHNTGWAGRYFLSYKHAGAELVNPCPGDLATPLYMLETRMRNREPGWDEPVVYDHNPPRGEPVATPTPERLKVLSRMFGPMELLDQPVKFTPSGRPIWTLPGSTGVEVCRIYTFLRSE